MDDQPPKPQPSNEPSSEASRDSAGSATPASSPPPAPARSVMAPASSFDSTPIYRVVEVTRDGNGRLRKEGRVWHTDLNRMRKFGRAVASNTASHKVLITDATGDVMEELSPPAAEDRQPRWDNWQSIALPPCPPKARHKPRTNRPAPAPLPSGPNPFGALDVDALRNTLAGAAQPATAPAAAEPSQPAPPENEATPGSDIDVQVLLP